MEPKSQSGDPLETLVLFFNKFYSIFSFLWSEMKEVKKEPLSQACHPHTLDANVCEKTKAGQLHTSNKNIDPRTCLYSIWVQTQILCVCLYACVSVCRGVCVCVCARACVEGAEKEEHTAVSQQGPLGSPPLWDSQGYLRIIKITLLLPELQCRVLGH